MTLNGPIATLESAGLIELAGINPEIEYIFSHVLIQDAVYDSLLKSEQHSLHRTAAEVLEQLYGDRREELAGRLAYHFWRAGDPQRALPYFLIAARRASAAYANAEAVQNYGSALKAAEDNPAVQIEILQERGNSFDLMGEFELARSDYETALELSEANGDVHSQWQASINLGGLWAARDYQQTGAYYQRALDLARGLRDNRTLAYSLNRSGNYFINQDRPDDSRLYHEEALLIFNQLNDQDGVAETKDLLGMSNALGGDMVAAAECLRESAALFEKMGNLRSLASSLTTLAIMTNTSMNDSIVSAHITLPEGIEFTRRALQIAADIGWRSGETYSLCNQTLCLTAHGDYDQAIACAQKGAVIAEQIQHRQWATFIYIVTGMLYLDIFQLARAREALEKGLSLAQQNHSEHWTHVTAGDLALVLIQAGDLAGAQALLDPYLSADTPARTFGQRVAWSARATLALARGDPQAALAIVQKLTADAVVHSPNDVMVRVWQLRGEALSLLAEQTTSLDEKQRLNQQAEATLREVLKEAAWTEYHSKIWRIHLALARVYENQGRAAEAKKERQIARSLVQKLGKGISDAALRRTFLQQALAVKG